ncbi:hypothetical protein KIN20_008757 [Parelaphostrongylus tenuis]|uniref:Uncharacterized protein n=1 Tax=Parelaphostrongylus tenuis TaxID=148309 RepID=A0AAD5M590_PARTN|nr:hypothetical protein KIN20_008757 [Parelaphostrongylus tenuis]
MISARIKILTGMARPSIDAIISLLLATILTVSGCGVLPGGLVSTRKFNITDFVTVPIAMVYTNDSNVAFRFPSMSTSKEQVRLFVERVVKHAVTQTVEHLGRSSFLPDSVTYFILSQLTVTVNYEPFFCKKAVTPEDTNTKDNVLYCVIIGNTFTGDCIPVNDGTPCGVNDTTLGPTDRRQRRITGEITTTNIIMANWPTAMWQSVVDRAVQMLAYGPLERHFFSATVTVGER